MKPQTKTDHTTKRSPPSPEQIRSDQKRRAEADHAAVKAALPVKAASTAVAPPGNRTPIQLYLDEIAPAAIVGRMLKFNGKDGVFKTTDDDETISDDIVFVALCDQTLIGWIKFNGDGEPPDRVMGLLYDGWTMPARETLGDDDQSKWEMGLDGKPADPWTHQLYLVLQRGGTDEMFTFVTSSITGRRAVGNLLRHFDRLEKARSGAYPIVRLKVGGYQDRRPGIGWVNTPVFAVVGRQPKDSTAKPDSPPKADLNDEIPFN